MIVDSCVFLYSIRIQDEETARALTFSITPCTNSRTECCYYIPVCLMTCGCNEPPPPWLSKCRAALSRLRPGVCFVRRREIYVLLYEGTIFHAPDGTPSCSSFQPHNVGVQDIIYYMLARRLIGWLVGRFDRSGTPMFLVCQRRSESQYFITQ